MLIITHLKPAVGYGRLFVLCRFLLVFCVGHDFRTGDFLLIPSDTENK